MTEDSSVNTITAPAPKWTEYLVKVRTEGFSSPWKSGNEQSTFDKYMATVVAMEDSMHFDKNNTQPYIKHPELTDVEGQGVPNYSFAKLAKIPEKGNDIETVIRYLMRKMFSSMNNPHHPLFLTNVIPPPSLAGLLGTIIAMKLNANIVDEHLSMNVAKAELELAAMICHLLPIGHGDNKWPRPWAPLAPDSSKHFEVAGVTEEGHGSGGISTFGGTGCYLYGVKYALTKVANSGGPPGYCSRRDGFEQGKFVFMCSIQGHYVNTSTSDWAGIGYKNAIVVATKADNTLDHDDLRKKMAEAKSAGKVVFAVIPTFGTTDAGALEDLHEVRKIIRDFENIEPYAKPVLYADSVIGWVWLFFIDYDFQNNPLGFREDLLERIKFNTDRARGLAEADAFGTDFHKTGYSQYVASMFMVKDYGDFASLMQRPPPPYLQQEQYDPALYTLETSRSPSGVIGPWATFKHLGKDGMRSIMYNLLEKQDYLRKKLKETGCVVICNEENFFYSTLFRISPFEYNHEQYVEELSDESKYELFKHRNEFQKLIYLRTYEQLRKNSDSKLITPHLGISTGYRYTYYNPHGDRLEPDNVHLMQGVFALKVFLSSPFIDFHHMDLVIETLFKARSQVLIKLLEDSSHPIYKKQVKLVHDERPDGVHPHHNIIPVKFLPTHHILPDGYDAAELKEKLKEEIKERISNIEVLQQKITETTL